MQNGIHRIRAINGAHKGNPANPVHVQCFIVVHSSVVELTIRIAPDKHILFWNDQTCAECASTKSVRYATSAARLIRTGPQATISNCN